MLEPAFLVICRPCRLLEVGVPRRRDARGGDGAWYGPRGGPDRRRPRGRQTSADVRWTRAAPRRCHGAARSPPPEARGSGLVRRVLSAAVGPGGAVRFRGGRAQAAEFGQG